MAEILEEKTWTGDQEITWENTGKKYKEHFISTFLQFSKGVVINDIPYFELLVNTQVINFKNADVMHSNEVDKLARTYVFYDQQGYMVGGFIGRHAIEEYYQDTHNIMKALKYHIKTVDKLKSLEDASREYVKNFREKIKSTTTS